MIYRYACLILPVKTTSIRASSYPLNSLYQSSACLPRRCRRRRGRHKPSSRPPSFFFLSLQETLKNNSCALGALLIWSRRAQGKKKVSFIFSKIQTKEEKNWPCFREPFTSNLCLFSFFFRPLSAVLSTSACFFLHFALLCLHFCPASRLSVCLFFSSLLTLTTSLLFLSAAAAFFLICQAPG